VRYCVCQFGQGLVFALSRRRPLIYCADNKDEFLPFLLHSPFPRSICARRGWKGGLSIPFSSLGPPFAPPFFVVAAKGGRFFFMLILPPLSPTPKNRAPLYQAWRKGRPFLPRPTERQAYGRSCPTPAIARQSGDGPPPNFAPKGVRPPAPYEKSSCIKIVRDPRLAKPRTVQAYIVRLFFVPSIATLVLLKSVTEFWRRGSRSARRRKNKLGRSKLSDHDALAKTRRSTDPGRKVLCLMVLTATCGGAGRSRVTRQDCRRHLFGGAFMWIRPTAARIVAFWAIERPLSAVLVA
jgi:hypothetical protein